MPPAPSAAPLADLPTISGYPTFIPDGDTLHIGDVKIRLKGIDTPERGQPYADDATRALKRLTANGVTCKDSGERSYNRVVAWCYTPDGRDIGGTLVLAGWAKNVPFMFSNEYPTEHRAAEEAGLGIHQR